MILKGLHLVARQLFKQAGFKWELRRNGDLKLGFWRKELGRAPRSRTGARAIPKTAPKRFVLVPGFGDTSFSWFPVISILMPVLKRAGYDEIVILDFPGFNGFLAGERSFPSMDLMLAAVSDAFDSLAPETVMGHSLGGWLTARYAVDCGKGVRPTMQKRHGYSGPRRVVLVCPAGIHGSERIRAEFEQVFRQMVGGEGIEAVRRRLFAKEPFWFKYLAHEFGRFSGDEGIRQFTESVRDDHLLQGELGHVKAETWLVWGDRDTLCPTESVQAWLEGLRGAAGGSGHAVLVLGSGHSPQLEKTAVTAAVLGQVLLGRKPHARGARWWKVLAPGILSAGTAQ